MITIKLNIETNISKYLQEYNNVVHFAYNRYQENLTQKDIETIIKTTMNNINLMDSSFIKAATDKAKDIKDKEKVTFGSKSYKKKYERQLKYLKRKYINDPIAYQQEKVLLKEEFVNNRQSRPIRVRGSTTDHKGNRKFELCIKEHNQIIFKPSRYEHITIQLPRTKHYETLCKLQELCELGETYFTCELNNTQICITYDETIFSNKEYKPILNRILSIDLNPNFISFVICDYDKNNRKNILHKEIFALTELNTKGKTNKIHHELFQICKYIINLGKHYKIETLAYEDLNMESKDKGKGTFYNYLTNNVWNRNLVVNNLIKRCNIASIKAQKIITPYSSFIGQIDNPNDYDSIAAAIEIGRRANIFIRKFIKKEESVVGCIMKHNDVIPENLMNRWKKQLGLSIVGQLTSYLDLYNLVKTKNSYRFLFSFIDMKEKCFRFFSVGSMVYRYL